MLLNGDDTRPPCSAGPWRAAARLSSHRAQRAEGLESRAREDKQGSRKHMGTVPYRPHCGL